MKERKEKKTAKIMANVLIAILTLAIGLSIGQPLLAADTNVTDLATRTHFHGIAVDRKNPSRILLATHHGLHVVSPDGKAVRISETTDDFMGFTPHPVDPKILYGSGHPVGGGNLGFITSTNGGKSWVKLADGIGGPVDFHQMDVSKADPNVIIGVFAGLQISKNGGRTWAKAGPAPGRLIDLAASAKQADTFYAATQSGLTRSTNGGRTWQAAHSLRQPVSMVHVTSNGIIYAYQLGEGLIRTSETGLNWKLVNNKFGGAYILHFAVNPANEKTLYAITMNPKTRSQAIIMSRDGGKTWNKIGKS
jgi:BNR/Asp-box repeat